MKDLLNRWYCGCTEMVCERFSDIGMRTKSRSVHLKKVCGHFPLRKLWECWGVWKDFLFILHPIRGNWNGRMMMGREGPCLASKPWSSPILCHWTCHSPAPPHGYGLSVQLVCFYTLSKALINYTVQRTSLKRSVLIIKRSILYQLFCY